MRPTTIRPGAKLISVKEAEKEYGLPAALLRDLIKRGEVTAVQPPNVRRIRETLLPDPAVGPLLQPASEFTSASNHG